MSDVHFHVLELEAGGGCLWAQEDADCDRCCYGECDGGEEAEDVLDAHEAGVHVGWVAVTDLPSDCGGLHALQLSGGAIRCCFQINSCRRILPRGLKLVLERVDLL